MLFYVIDIAQISSHMKYLLDVISVYEYNRRDIP